MSSGDNPKPEDFTLGGSLKLAEPVSLPEVLDVLVVGGGPAGTAAAFRAKELGLSALVIDYDDLMKRIRDYSKEKEILPNFGGGDTLPFPEGDDLVRKLRFDPTDKDEMVLAWKGYYRSGSVPARIGVELLGLGERAHAAWDVKCFNRRTQEPITYKARHVVLAIGRGVPRRFDIPGDTTGIAFRLDDPDKYVGGPACVIGGGTSAAEAVIAISNAKVKAEDATLVYWSYRGESMPKVSDSISKAFFDAFVGNGNVVYLRRSEPAAVVVGFDRQEYLSIRVDRKEMAARPTETVHMEFPKAKVVACIGEDVPEPLLNSMGIQLGEGPDGKKRMLVTRELVTQRECVYLVGDLLAPYYWRTDSFSAPPESWEKVKHQGNIKTALADGVLAAEVIHARRQDKAKPPPSAPAKPAAAPAKAAATRAKAAPAPPPVEEPPPAPAAPAATVKVACVQRLDGSGEPETFSMRRPVLSIGREGCDVNLVQDPLVSQRHASVVFDEKANVHELRDEGSENGTFVFLKGRESGRLPLRPGALMIAGKQRLHLGRSQDGSPVVIHCDPADVKRAEHALEEGETLVGREAPVALDPEDRTLSASHLSLFRRGDAIALEDHSRNGTLVRISGPHALHPGEKFVVGKSYFTFVFEEYAPPPAAERARVPGTARQEGDSSEAPAAKPSPAAAPAAKPAPIAKPAPAAKTPAPSRAPPPPLAEKRPVKPPPAGAARAAGQPSVEFEGFGTFPIKPAQSILDLALAMKVPFVWDCKEGTCGADPVEVVEGQEFLSPMGETEESGLENAGSVPAGCRLACCLKGIRGPVKVRLVKKT
ncbi:MAG: FAD-dependent oxidoreductase [Planctomycetes bacterium]|nr:FAD-dependent oxidoreductase [Planctomycetota bacterium]